jgi:phenylalanyl-tRNA synthetase beta chain
VNENQDSLEVLVPNYRVDVDREIDIIEEILRIYGFNTIPFPEKLNTSLVISSKPDLERLGVNISEVLAGMGFNEILNNSLTSPAFVEKLGKESLKSELNVEMLNPLSQDLAVMRQSLVFQALETVAHNQNRQNPNVKLFEFGKVYKKVEGVYKENKRLLITLTGRKQDESWDSTNDKVSFYTLKGVVNSFLERLGLRSMIQENELIEKDLFVDGLSLSILKNQIGSLAWVNSETRKHFGVKSDVFVADLDWDALMDSLKFYKTQYKELPKFFEVRRDFSLLLNTNVKFEQIKNIAHKIDKKILQQVGLFDVYEGKNLPEGKKSYAVSFIFQDAEQTLKDTQVDAIMEKIRIHLEQELSAELRS